MQFRLSLALRLGRTLAELEQTMTAREMFLWHAYDRISPIGDGRGDIHAAQIASAIYQSVGAKVSMSDAIIDWSPSPPPPIDETQIVNFFEKLM